MELHFFGLLETMMSYKNVISQSAGLIKRKCLTLQNVSDAELTIALFCGMKEDTNK
jgi:hypothetical protein